MFRFARLPLLAMLLLLFAPVLAQSTGGRFLPPDQAFSHQATREADGSVRVAWDIAPGYYLYRHQFEVDGKPEAVKAVGMPKGEAIHDDYFGDAEVYHDRVVLRVDPGRAQTLDLTWQGCAEAGLCYPPQHASVDLAVLEAAAAADTGTGAGPGEASAAAPDATGGELAQDQSLAARLADSNVAWVLAIFFGLGLLLVFTPCVLPMLPILTSLVVGSGARGKRGLALSVAYVLPMAIAYAVLGVVAAVAGANLQAVLQTPWVLGAFALVFVALAMSMFGFYELQLPAVWRNRLDRMSSRQSGGSLAGAAIMGVLSALLVGPCMTAPLAGALLYIADTGNVVLGGSALFALGLGMGAPLVLVGTVGAHLLPRPGAWMNGVKVVFGFILLAMAIWFVARVLPAHAALALWGAWLLAMGVTVGHAVHGAGRTRPTALLSRIVGVLGALWGALLIIGAAGGGTSWHQPLAFAGGTTGSARSTDAGDRFMQRFDDVDGLDGLQRRVAQAGVAGRWTMVDFYADWCISCKVIEAEVFADADVQAALGDVELLRPDVTANNDEDRALMRHFGIIGPPTILFIGPDGEERRAARVVGELDAADFMRHLTRARADS